MNVIHPIRFTAPLRASWWLCAAVAIPLILGASARAQDKKLWTLDALYGPQGKVDFDGKYARDLTWLPDGTAYIEARDDGYYRVSVADDAATPLFDRAALQAALAGAGLPEADAERLSKKPSQFSEDFRRALIEHASGWLLFDVATGSVRRLDAGQPPREVPKFSPDGARLAYVQQGDLYVLELERGESVRLTSDGSETVLNGKLDWVYQEEVYGRGNYRAYWWSENGRRLAFLQLDVSREPITYLVDHAKVRAEPQRLRYPKAGEPNAGVRLGVVTASGGGVRWIETGLEKPEDLLIVRVGFHPNGTLHFQVQDRCQSWLKLYHADAETGSARLVLTERDGPWVDADELPLPAQRDRDERLVWRAARAGHTHLYLHEAPGKTEAGRDAGGGKPLALTQGPWEVRKVHGVDPTGAWVYFSASKDSTIEEHVYRAPLTGGAPQRLTEPGYQHRALFDPTFTHFIDTYSSVMQPPRVALRRADGTLVRMISENPLPLLNEYAFGETAFVRVKNRDGFELNGLMIRPQEFDPSPAKGYPVLCIVYAGPAAPLVQNRWDTRNLLFAQLLAQNQIITFLIDPRAACGGAGGAARVHRRLGADELADIEDAVGWLQKLPYVDRNRIGIMGHSYGGFMTLYALTHSDKFRMGIASAPVADWRNYDSIYTERYMGLPHENAEGYQAASIVEAAGKLKGRLLLVHGTLDDNVHVDNSLQLIQALQKAGIKFDFMLYPQATHNLAAGGRHYHELRFQFILERL